MPILDSLGVVGEENASKKMQEVIADMQRRLRAGSSFGDAIAQHTKVFPGYYIAVVRAAELTGQLDDALDQLSEYLEREVATRREIKSALTYPIIVFFLAIVAVIIMAAYVLPKFRTFYTSLGAHLPLPTRMLLGFTNFMSNWWWLVLLLVVVVIARGRSRCIGGDARQGAPRPPRCCGCPPSASSCTSSRSSGSAACSRRSCTPACRCPTRCRCRPTARTTACSRTKLATVREAMMRGEGLARPIQASGLFPPAARQMIRVGESTGSLDAQLDNAARRSTSAS